MAVLKILISFSLKEKKTVIGFKEDAGLHEQQRYSEHIPGNNFCQTKTFRLGFELQHTKQILHFSSRSLQLMKHEIYSQVKLKY